MIPLVARLPLPGPARPARPARQLKRFESLSRPAGGGGGGGAGPGPVSHKMDTHVQFPLALDMSPYVAGGGGGGPLWHRLYSVVEHTGKLDSGHYTAFVRQVTAGGGGGC